MGTITGIRRLERTICRYGSREGPGPVRSGGDNWHTTWANNDKQYVALSDGFGWPEVAGYAGRPYNTRVYAINGDAPDHTFEYLPGYPDLYTGDAPKRYPQKVCKQSGGVPSL